MPDCNGGCGVKTINRPFGQGDPDGWLLLLVVLLAGALQLQAAFVVDNFDSYSVGSNVNALANGWGGAVGAIVTNIDYSGGAGNSAYVPQDAVVSNTVNQLGVDYPRIWTETCIQQDQRLDLTTAPLAVDGRTVMLGVDTDGHLAAYDPAVTSWVSYATDVWGTNVTLGVSDWARVCVMHNFSNHTAALFLNGHLMKPALAFMTNLDDYGSFRLDSGGLTNALLDNAYVSNAVPPSLTNVDLDMDLMADALEIQTYGDITTRRWWTNTVSSMGNGNISPSGAPFTVVPGSNMTYTLTAPEAYGVGAVTNNGADGSASLSGVGTRQGQYIDSNITDDRVITAWFVYTGIRYVPGDHSTITGAQEAAYEGGQFGDHLVVSNGVYNESLVLSNGVILVGTNMTASASDTNLTVNGTMMVVTGTVSSVGLITVTGQVTIAAGGLLTISDSTVNFGGLTVGAGGSVQVVNGSVTIAGTTRTGTFTLNENWEVTLTPVVLDYTDGFETYPVNTDLGSLGLLGWSASEAGAVVQSAVAALSSTRSVLMPTDIVVSNTVEAGHTNVWTEVYVKADSLMEPDSQPLVNSNLTVQLFVGTNGYLTLYNRDVPGWDVCSNNVLNKAVAKVSAGQWLRITVYQNFSNHTTAVFLNDKLLREQVPFISDTVAECHGFSLEGGHGGTNYLDMVKIWRSAQGMGLLGDYNQNGIGDAQEIEADGVLGPYCPSGSVFKIR
jgi:hypothetical protein